MTSLMNLPDDFFKQQLLQYLTVRDIARLDTACTSHQCRGGMLVKLTDVILVSDLHVSLTMPLFEWLGRRRIYLRHMRFETAFTKFERIIEYQYLDQCKHATHLSFGMLFNSCSIVLIVKLCGRLQSLDLSFSSYVASCDRESIFQHCSSTGLQALDLRHCYNISDSSVQSLSKCCTGLQSLDLSRCSQLTDASILSLSQRVTGLQSLNLTMCWKITDASVASICYHCMTLETLILTACDQLTDASLFSISEQQQQHCGGRRLNHSMKTLNLARCVKITDEGIASVALNCSALQSLDAAACPLLTDASIKSIAQHCTQLHRCSFISCHGISIVYRKNAYYSRSDLLTHCVS